MGIGGGICKFAYIGSVTRYMANEVAPVGKDVVNYMADGTKGAVRDVAAAVGEGLRSGSSGQSSHVIQCQQCHTQNESSANFCKSCGSALPKLKACADCGEVNDHDARFCDNCGKAMV